jgi:hypothetical protein
VLLTGLLLVGAPSSVAAYGPNAIWQIGLSFNCNNPDVCGAELGGFRGWVEFDSGGGGDATLTGCSHMTAAGPVHVAGADHFSIEIEGWTIASGSAGPQTFFITAGTMTFTGRGGRTTVPSTEPIDTGIPAVPGHYSTQEILGFNPPPGVAIQIQVVKIPNR